MKGGEAGSVSLGGVGGVRKDRIKSQRKLVGRVERTTSKSEKESAGNRSREVS